ncbi:nuclear receptor-interacting protein 2 [Engraulis encrasicolus]|uniref:nuclear receptor-interacting protein 2 n=1 Tax=Engraulis encrasicolus TaxID=184585 RepID=UPI002FCEE949
MSETSKKRELDMRDKAILHQQRRLKQATQFTHKDSADLLPLDGLKRLGTSKDLQPHSIVQRRLLEGNMPRLRGAGPDGLLHHQHHPHHPQDPLAASAAAAAASRVRSPLANSKEGSSGGVSTETEERSESTADDSTEERESPEESEKSLRSEEDEDEDEDDEDDEDDEEEDDHHRERRKRRGVKTGSGGLQTSSSRAPPGRNGGSEKSEEEKETDGEKEGRETSTPLAALVVQCKCHDADVKASINTGCQHNHISRSCCRRLGLKPSVEVPAGVKAEGPQGRVQSQGQEAPTGSLVGGLQIQLGRDRVQCSAQLTDDEGFDLCLGLQTLLELKCCVDLSSRVLRLQASGEEVPFLDVSSDQHSQCHHDNNKNM